MMFPKVDRPTPAEKGEPGVALDKIVTALQAVIEFLGPYKDPLPWTNLPLLGDWTRDLATLRGPQFARKPNKYVQLRGWAKTPKGAATTIATLPINARPRERESFACACVSGGVSAFARVDVIEDGRVLLVAPAVAAGTEVSLSGIEFDTRV